MLEKPTEIPEHLYSSTKVLETQKAHCFEYSHLLCSLLLGAGYDAYVVSGYASRAVTLLDLTTEECPLLAEKGKDKEEVEEDKEPPRYAARPPRSLESGFKEKVGFQIVRHLKSEEILTHYKEKQLLKYRFSNSLSREWICIVNEMFQMLSRH